MPTSAANSAQCFLRKIRATLRGLLIVLSLCLIPVVAGAQTTVTGHVLLPNTTAPAVPNAKVRFTLTNFSPNVPRVIGTGAIVAQRNFCITPAADGSFSTSLYGNKVITPTSTNWRVDLMFNGIQQSSATYLINHSPFNLDTETPLSTSTPAVPNRLVTQAFPFSQLVAATFWTITHNLGNSSPIVEVYDTSGNLLDPTASANPFPTKATSPNVITITFTNPQAGTATVMSAGPISIATTQPNAVLQNPVAGQAIGGPSLAIAAPYSTNVAGIHSGPAAAGNFNKIIYAGDPPYNVICDGVTVNSTSVINAIAAGGQNAHVVFPSGTCLVNIDPAQFAVYDGSWYSGAGKFATIIKRANGGIANNHIFLVASGGAFGSTGNVLFTDMAIDGNQSNQTGWGDNIRGTAPTSKFTALRMRIINSGSWGINLALGAANQNNTDVLIADNDFESNGIRSGCAALPCSDISIQAPLRVRVMRNRSDSSFLFFESGGLYGAGQVTISDNNINACTSFAVALGGGGTNPGPAAISNNTFNCPGNAGNTVDMALWSGVRVQNNNINFGGTGIADGPPSNNVQITGNKLFGAPGNQGYCIGPGGSEMLIADNYCTSAGLGGIGVNNGGTNFNAKGTILSNNIIKNANQQNTATHCGIEVNNNSGGTFNGVIIKGNKAYDDQGTPTQSYGICTNGTATGYSNITIEGNDVRQNKLGGINFTATPTTGVVIANNPGGESSYLCQLTTCPTQTIGSGTVTTAGTAVGAGVSQSYAITINGALATDTAACSLKAAMPATWQTGIQVLPPVVTANTVTVWLSNPTAASITPATAVVRCTVTR
jgi:hypothetical protein